MPEFLELKTIQEALKLFFDHLPEAATQTEEVRLAAALGRVLAEDIVSREPLPGFTRSTVDGFAVRSRDTHGASETLPMYLPLAGEVPMGKAPGFALQAHQAARIHTGGMLPEGADAVVMLEMCQEVRAGEIEVYRAVAAGENILARGEDIEAGETVLPAGKSIRPVEIAGLAALGYERVRVFAAPALGILSSGDEVIPIEQTPGIGQVRDVNSHALAALVSASGGIPVLYGIIPDRQETLEERLAQALDECQGVIITAGSSASTRDLTADAIRRMGEPGVLVHGVNVKPGKPTILGVCRGKPVVGLPGNPVSALVIAGLFIRPLVRRLAGETYKKPQAVIQARISSNVPSQAGREDFFPVILKKDGLCLLAEPIFYKSNLIFNLARADGLAHIPADATGLAAGEDVEVIPL